MTKKIIIPIIATALFIVAVGILIQRTRITTLPTQIVKEEPSVTISNTKISVSLARTQQERERGLSGTSSLDTNSGMLFIFEDKDISPVFWMKDTLIPLDIIWIAEGKIVKIDKNVPLASSDTPDNKLATYSAGRPVDYVLEVNSGFTDKSSIKVGDAVSVSGI